MLFRTEYKARRQPLTLTPDRPLVLMGSCFSDRIGAVMRRCGWDACSNPCGTLFNPSSIASHLLGENYSVEPEGFSFSFPAAFTTRDSMDQGRGLLRSALERSQALIVTFGTAIVYEKDARIVANCHKRPASQFRRRMLAVEEIVELWIRVVAELRKRNPELAVVLTVSPVRHVREGFEENSASKATLLLACRRLCAGLPAAFYFPSFEIVTDDLRDYRFFESDMVHPSPVAVEYIWEKFRQTYLDAGGDALIAAGEALRRRLEHRPLHPGSPEAEAFGRETERVKSELLASHPALRF